MIPILCFVLLFWFLALRRLLEIRPLPAILAIAGMFSAIAVVIALAPAALNGSAAYLPVLMGLGVLAVLIPQDASRSRLRFAASGFAASLTARTLDHSLCAEFPIGTHWL